MSTPTLLIPLDGSDFSREIVPHVRSICSPEKFDIVLLRVAGAQHGVIPPPPRPSFAGAEFSLPTSTLDDPTPSHTIYPAQAEESLRIKLTGELNLDARLLEEAGFSVAREVRFGDPTTEILKYAEQEGVSLVAMATHGRSGLRRLVLGSVAEKVLRRLSVPILLVRPTDGANGETREAS